MVDYIFGLLLFAFGLGSHPSVLGEQTGTASQKLAQLKLMRPKFTPDEQEMFQKERAKREANLKRVSETKIAELQKAFTEKKESRLEKDETARAVFQEKVQGFADADKKQKMLTFSTTYRATVTVMLDSMEEKLESMMKLIDRISAATGALKVQGTDVSKVESDLASAQAKVSSALFAVTSLAESLPTTLAVNSEETAKEDVLQAITDVKSQIVPVRAAFTEARDAVGLALTDLENLTDAVQVGLWPQR